MNKKFPIRKFRRDQYDLGGDVYNPMPESYTIGDPKQGESKIGNIFGPPPSMGESKVGDAFGAPPSAGSMTPINQNGPQVSSVTKTEFGLNYKHIAQSNFMKGILSFIGNKKDQADQRSYQKTQTNPLLQLPSNPNVTHDSLYGFQQGGLTPEKAAQILHDGTAHKKPLTDKQRKFFGAMSNKQLGGQINYVGYVDPLDVNNKMIINSKMEPGLMQSSGVKSAGTYNYKTPNGGSGIIDKARYDAILKEIGKGKVKDGVLYSEGMNPTDVVPYLKFQDGGTVDAFESNFEKDLFDDPAEAKPEATPEVKTEEQPENEAVEQPQEEEQIPDIQYDPARYDFKSDNENDEEDETETPGTATGSPGILSGNPPSGQGVIYQPNWTPSKENENISLEAFKKGISHVESEGDYTLGNKHSTAYGKYQILNKTGEDIRSKYFPELSPTKFEQSYRNSPEFQERVMDKFAGSLLNRYKDPHKAAIAFFLGPGNVDKMNDPSYTHDKNNLSIGTYLKRFDEGYKYQMGGDVLDPPDNAVDKKSFISKNEPKFRGYDIFNKLISENIDPYKAIDSPQGKVSAYGALNSNLGEDDARTLFTAAQIFNTKSDVKNLSTKERMDKFYNSYSNNPKLDALKEKIKSIPGLYNTSPVLQMGGEIPKYKIDQEYEVDDKEVNRLRKLGYDFDIK